MTEGETGAAASNPLRVHGDIAIDKEGHAWAVASALDGVSALDTNGTLLETFKGGGISKPWSVAVDSRDNIWVANFGDVVQRDFKFRISELCGAAKDNYPAGHNSMGDPITPDTGYSLPSGGDEVRLHSGKPINYPFKIKSYKPLMRLTAVLIDMAGNVWAINNWKADAFLNAKSNPGGDGVVIFVGLAAPVMPQPYSAPPQAP